jgi:hypothetical protein
MTKEVSESAYEYLLAELLSVCKYRMNSEDKISQRLEHLGYEIGYRYIEKIVPQLRYLGSEPLDLVKFICKEFWEEIFKKKVILFSIKLFIYLNIQITKSFYGY